jgi:imidazolonepropionase-like amidohydrolase
MRQAEQQTERQVLLEAADRDVVGQERIGVLENPFEAAWVAERGPSPALCCRAEAASEVHAAWFRKALDAGVRMAVGSDIRPLKEAALLEMGLWVRDGATPWQTLVAATRHGAAVCGVGAELGTVEVGKLADLIVVGANPLEDITNVRQLQLVLKEGRVISDKRHLSVTVH